MLAISGTCLVGTLAWIVAWQTGTWTDPGETPDEAPHEMGAQILGYISAVLYLGARVPQIMQNYRKQSCEGMTNCAHLRNHSDNI